MPSYDYMMSLDRDSAQRREVFAWFGRASYHAQCVERSLSLLVASMRIVGDYSLDAEDREALFNV